MLDFGGPAASQAAICEPEGKDVTGRWVAASTLEPKVRRAELVGRVLMWVGRLVISPSYTFRRASQAPYAKGAGPRRTRLHFGSAQRPVLRGTVGVGRMGSRRSRRTARHRAGRGGRALKAGSRERSEPCEDTLVVLAEKLCGGHIPIVRNYVGSVKLNLREKRSA
jgi:hypothetical protein